MNLVEISFVDSIALRWNSIHLEQVRHVSAGGIILWIILYRQAGLKINVSFTRSIMKKKLCPLSNSHNNGSQPTIIYELDLLRCQTGLGMLCMPLITHVLQIPACHFFVPMIELRTINNFFVNDNTEANCRVRVR